MHNSSDNNPVQPVCFSIVIPAYNSARFITTALDSVREQTFTDYEVLITNDGSQDDTEQVIAAYAGQYPDFPLKRARQENKGIGGARNNGLFRASGTFIAFLDADDRWLPRKLERMALFLTTHPHSDVVCHDEIEVRGDGSRHALSYGDVREPAYEDLLFRGNRLSTSATVIRRELGQQVGGFSEDMAFNSAEDYEFWLRLAHAGARFAHVPEVLGEYHRVEGSVTQKIEYHHRSIGNVIEHHLAVLRSEGAFSPRYLDRMVRRKRAENLAALGRAYAGGGDRARAIKTHWQAMRVDPLCWKNYLKLLRTVSGC